jgi:hypothetical protein
VATPIEVTITIENVLADGSLFGSGVIGSVHAAFAFDLEGLFEASSVTMVFGIVGEPSINFRGTLTSDNRIVGTLEGGGFDAFGISLEPVSEEGGGEEESQFDPSQPQPGVSEAFAGTYSGNWEVLIYAFRPNLPDPIEWLGEGSCSGSVTLDPQSLLDRLFGRTFSGSYLMLDSGSCLADGITVSGTVNDGQLRGDGGVNFGLQIPGSDGNFFEDVLAGSGFKPPQSLFVLLGCSIINKDTENQMDGSILGNRLSAIASASLDCPGGRGGTVNMSVAIDATK